MERIFKLPLVLCIVFGAIFNPTASKAPKALTQSLPQSNNKSKQQLILFVQPPSGILTNMVVVTEGRSQPPEAPPGDDNPEQIKSHVANKKWYVGSPE